MRKIEKLRPKIYLMLTAIYLVVGSLSLLLFYIVTPQRYFGIYPSVDVFYWAFGMVLTYFLDRSRVQHPDRLLNVFMMCRAVKLFLIIAFLILGIRGIGLDRVTFTISMMCNYLIYSGLELYIYYRFNKQLQQKK